MSHDASGDLPGGWQVLSVVLIYPMTIVAGLHAVVRIISGCFVTLDSWTFDGALGNFAMGFPMLAALASLWFSTIQQPLRFARDRGRFLLVTTGLMTGLIMECLFLRAGLARGLPRFWAPGLYELWMFAGPLLIGTVNLLVLIRERSQAFNTAPTGPGPSPVSIFVGPHQGIGPVRLRPFRRKDGDASSANS